MKTPLKEELDALTVHDLKVVARKTRLPGRSGLKKDDLIARLVEMDESRVRKCLRLSWWDRHRNNVFGWASVIGLVIAIGPRYSYFFSNEERRLAEIDAVRVQLQSEIDKAARRGNQLAGGMRVSADWLDALARSTPAVADVAKTLRHLLAKHDGEYGEDSQDARLVLAKAALANLEGRYSDTLKLLPVNAAGDHLQQAANVYRLQGDAFYAQRDWRQAETCYANQLHLGVHDLQAALRQADCLCRIGKLSEAIARYDDQIVTYTRLVVEGKDYSGYLASTLNNRGAALVFAGKPIDALEDLERTVEIRTSHHEHSKDQNTARDLATALHNRGLALSTVGQSAKALRDYAQSVELLRRHRDTTNDADSASLGTCLINRGNEYYSVNQPHDATGDFDEALVIFRKLSERTSMFAPELSGALSGRGSVLMDGGRLDTAYQDTNEAVDLLARLLADDKRPQLRLHHATTVMNRGNILRRLGKLNEALSDHNEAVAALAVLVDDEHEADAAADLGLALTCRGDTLEALGKGKDAERDREKAIAIYGRAAGDHGNVRAAQHLEAQLCRRAKAYVVHHDYARAADAYGKAIPVIQQVVRASGRPEYRWLLAEVMRNRGSCGIHLGNYSSAIHDLEAAIDVHETLSRDKALSGQWGQGAASQYIQTLSGLAWLMATSRGIDWRDGKKALRYATRACELTDWKDVTPLRVLAAASAEAGDFDSAAKWQEKTIDLAPAKEKAALRATLDQYRRKMPLREDVPTADRK